MKEDNKKIKTLNIFQKMSLVASQIKEVKKNLKVGKGTTSEYKAVKEGDVLKAVKPLEEQVGIYSYPFTREIVRDERLTFSNKNYDTENFVTRIKTTYRFVNLDNTSDFVDITSYGDGIDSQDKSPGKAMTYSDKYALMKAYKIETGDDENQKPQEIKKKEPTEEELKKRMILIAKFEKLVYETDTDKELIYRTYKVENNTKMSNNQLEQAIRKMEEKPIVRKQLKEEVF